MPDADQAIVGSANVVGGNQQVGTGLRQGPRGCQAGALAAKQDHRVFSLGESPGGSLNFGRAGDLLHALGQVGAFGRQRIKHRQHDCRFSAIRVTQGVRSISIGLSRAWVCDDQLRPALSSLFYPKPVNWRLFFQVAGHDQDGRPCPNISKVSALAHTYLCHQVAASQVGILNRLTIQGFG